MELVSAAKMRKATGNVLASRSYANVAWEIIARLSEKVKKELNPLLIQRSEIKNIALVVISSNRGLCGGFNNQIIQKALQYIKENESKADIIDIITMGQKCYNGIVKANYTPAADFEKKDITTSITDIYSLSHLVVNDFINKKYDKVIIAYTDYVSALTQKPRIMQLLPLSTEDTDSELGAVGKADEERKAEKLVQEESSDYVLEPDPKELLDIIVPKIIEIRLYQAVLESDASEHSARMMAMKNANESASDMISELTLIYNQARQAGITKEISEISGGKAALEE